MIKFFVLFLLCIGFVGAVSVDTVDYRIDCLPEVATIQSNGFVSTCEYTWKGLGNKSIDLGYCFDDVIESKGLKVKDRDKFLDLKDSLKKISLKDIKDDIKGKGDVKLVNADILQSKCDVLNNQVLESLKPKSFQFQYFPTNVDFNKWSAYIDDKGTFDIDSVLDPVYNTSLYELGTSRASNYNWYSFPTWNSDISSAGVWGFQYNITNYLWFNAGSITNSTSMAKSSGCADVWSSASCIVSLDFTYSKIRNITILFEPTDPASQNDYGVRFYHLDGSYTEQNILNKVGAYTGTFTDTTDNVTVYIDICSSRDSGGGSMVFGNRTTSSMNSTNVYLSNGNGIVVSNNITLPILVNNFKLVTSYSGAAFINISFDGIIFNYMNLSNTSQINLTDNVTDNNKMSYVLYLNSNTTVVNNVSILFNGFSNRIDVYIRNESNQVFITQFTTVTLTDLTIPNVVVNTTNSGNTTFLNLNLDYYEVKVSSANYSTRYYYIDIGEGESGVVNAYLLPIASANNVTFTFYDPNNAVINNLHVYMYVLSNNSYLLVEDHFSNIIGKASFVYAVGSYYKFCPVKDGFSTDCFVLNPISDSSYQITIQFNDTIPDYPLLDIVGSLSFDDILDTFTFSYVSTDSSILNYSYTVSRLHNGNYDVLCTNSSSALTGSFYCNVTGYTGKMFVQGVADYYYVFYDSTYDILGATKFVDVLDSLDAAYIVAFLLAIIMFSGLLFGVLGVLSSGIIGLLVMYWLDILTPLTDIVIAVVIVVSIIIYAGIRRNG